MSNRLACLVKQNDDFNGDLSLKKIEVNFMT